MAIGVKVRKGSATNARARRAFRVRKKVAGTATRPRFSRFSLISSLVRTSY